MLRPMLMQHHNKFGDTKGATVQEIPSHWSFIDLDATVQEIPSHGSFIDLDLAPINLSLKKKKLCATTAGHSSPAHDDAPPCPV